MTLYISIAFELKPNVLIECNRTFFLKFGGADVFYVM